MNDIITAPIIDHFIRLLRGGDRNMDLESLKLMDELFSTLKPIKPCGEDERRELWLTAKRGTLKDFRDYSELTEEEQDDVREEYENWRLEEYPEETVWFKLLSIEHDDFRAIAVGQQVVIQQRNREAYECGVNITSFLKWLTYAVNSSISMLRDGTYNAYVRAELPYRHRVGTISRGEYWSIMPGAKERELLGLSEKEIEEFILLMRSQTREETPVLRMKEMTAGKFFDFCAQGYKANGYEGAQSLSPKELYLKYADGRDDGLCQIAEWSEDAFHAWLNDRKRLGGHPWEVCRGGNSTHISLYVSEDERGYYLTLAGSAWTRTVETVKFFLVLVKEGIPVQLIDGKVLSDRVVGLERIGIVPYGVIPAYCSNYFPHENVIDYMNVPLEKEKLFAACALWQEIPEQQLSERTMD